MPIKELKATTPGDRTFSAVWLSSGAKVGPVTVNHIRKLFAEGRIAADCLITESGNESDAKPLHFFFDLRTWKPVGKQQRKWDAMRFRLAGLFIVGTSIVAGIHLWGAYGADWRRYVSLALTAAKVLVYTSLFFGVGRRFALWLCGWSLIDSAIDFVRAVPGESRIPAIAGAVMAMSIAGMLFDERPRHKRDLACFAAAVLAFAAESFLAP